ncbi:hypothetical protein Tco_1095008 [Tanacetum coccineum]
MSVFGAAKVSRFEILCRVYEFQPSVNCFRMFYTSSYTKGWMSFIKRSDAAPVCHSKLLDSVNWNDHFFWVDSTAFPFSVFLKSKILSKDPPPPKLSQYDTEACDFLRTHTAPFQKFPEPFLCWVGISRYYTLDENCYPTFWDGEEEMDLFVFICHSDLTKVRIRERDLAEREVKLLKMTEGRTVSLDPPVTAASGDSGDSIDKLFDEGDDAGQEHSVERDDNVLEETIAKDVLERLREDNHATTFITGGKSLATICSLIPEGSNVSSGIAEPRDDVLADSVSKLNLRTGTPSKRYVISSDDSYHSESRSEVNFFARSAVADTPVMTIVVTTTVAADASVVQVSKDKVGSENLETFGDFTSDGGANVNAASSLKLNEPTTSYSFYASQDLDSETPHNIYVPKWKVTNDSVLDDPYVCCDLTDRLAPPALFSQLRSMDYDQLYTEFNVGAARQMCLGAEVRMRAEHTLEQKDRLDDKCAEQTTFLSDKDVEIAHLRSLLSLKETEAAEVVHLRSQLSIVEAADAAKNAELRDLKERNFALEGEKDALSEKVATLEDRLADQCSSLESAFELFKERMEAMQDEQATILGNRVAELDAQLLEMAAHLDEEFYPRFLTTISGR